MRCGCPNCGLYMVQREQGVNSHCLCPNCGFSCSACVGTGGKSPIAKEDIFQYINHLHMLQENEEI